MLILYKLELSEPDSPFPVFQVFFFFFKFYSALKSDERDN
jgi:hypothetical protein